MRKIVVLFLACVLSLSSFAQLELGLFGGIANYQGDLTDKIYINSRGAFGFRVGYPVSNRITLRGGVTLAKLAGADSLTSQLDLRQRNLSFQTKLSEFSLVGEFNTFDLENKTWTPYVFAGLAVFHYNPYTYDVSGNKVYLKPLGTEGQGLAGYSRPYSLTQLAIPFGAGVKYRISERLRVGLELGFRKLFTDYLDDVSGNYADQGDLLTGRGQQSVDLSYRGDELPNGNPAYPAKGITRGSPKYNDAYYLTGIHLTWLLPGEGNGVYKPGRKKGYGCPTVF